MSPYLSRLSFQKTKFIRCISSCIIYLSVQLSCLVMSNSLQPHVLQHARLPCPSQIPGACSNLCSSSQWCHPTISFSAVPFSSYLQSFPAAESVPMKSGLFHFTLGGQSIATSASSSSVLPKNIQDWFPLELTGLISLLSKGLSRPFSNTSYKASILWCSAFFYRPTLTSIHDHWKNHSLVQMNLCWQSNVSAF